MATALSACFRRVERASREAGHRIEGYVRVIAGKYRSRRLQTLRGTALRPSSDRLRETLFNILGPAIEETIFVDLFAGSGAVGIEALSRGARGAIFVENHPAGAALISRNLESLGIPVAAQVAGRKTFAGTAEILRMDAMDALERLAEDGVRVDFVFADPPYSKVRAYQDVLAYLGESELLARGGCLIAEHRRKSDLPAIAGRLERTRVLEQGDTALSFYRLMLAA
jgi:16S rRNA (guanine966-N2)-methyltransferase